MHTLTFTVDAAPIHVTHWAADNNDHVVPTDSAPQSESVDWKRIVQPVHDGDGSRLWLTVKGGQPIYDGWTSPESLAIVLDYLRAHPKSQLAATWRDHRDAPWQGIGF